MNCRLDWRPSRLLPVALVLLGVLAALALLVSALPMPLALPAAAVAFAVGLGQARAESSRPEAMLVWRGGEDHLLLLREGRVEAWREASAVIRGGLAVVHGRDPHGCGRRLVWWPDTLSPRGRRLLRLATSHCARAAFSSGRD